MERSKFNVNGTEVDVVDAGAVRFDRAQALTDAQKQRARENIGANDIDAYTKAETDARLNNKADKTTTVNGKPLSGNVVLGDGDISYNRQDPDTGEWALSTVGEALDDLAQPFDGAGTTARTFSGAVITAEHTAAGEIADFTLYGRSVQNGTPSPDNPMPIQTAGSDGSVVVRNNSQTIAIPTPNGLPGIPVESGGNYTDESGQQWICDTIDKTAGTYVKRINKCTINDLSWWINNGYIAAGPDNLISVSKSGAPCICESYENYYDGTEKTFTDMPNRSIAVSLINYSSTPRILIRDDGYSNIETFYSEMGNNHIIYPVNSPITFELTPAQLSALNRLQAFEGSTTLYTTDDIHPEMSVSLGIGVDGQSGMVPVPAYEGQYLGSDGEWHAPDIIPVEGSDKLITSGAVYDVLTDNFDSLLSRLLNADNYTSMMKLWFSMNDAAALTDFSSLCDRWYAITRTGWTGGTRFYHWPGSGSGEGTKVGDNAGMVAQTSTNDTAGRDDYQAVPLFHCLDCNWFLDENGVPHITAIEGVCGNFERYNPDKLVGVIQMTGWHRYVDDAENDVFTHMYTDEIGASGYHPLPEAVNPDGTVRTWVVHAKYASGDDYGCYSGVHPWTYTASHNSTITAFHGKWGSQYGGKTSADDAFLKLMFYLKYANLSADGVLQGCVNYNYQYAVAVQETGVERVILTAAQAANIKIGSTVMVGNPTAFSGANLNIDRNQAGMRAKVDRKKVTRKETIAGGNVAIYIDNGGVTFDTTANTITNPGDSPTYISTSPWYTGTCDNVKGVDGSPTTPGTDAEPCILQGIEYALGAYEVVSDCIMKYYQDSNSKYHLTVYVCREASKYATSLNANYSLVDYEVDCPGSSSWQYISEHGYDITHPDVWFPHLIGCTSSQRTKDAIYILATSTSAYEWLPLGHMTVGVGYAGLSLVQANSGLGFAWWNILARLSPTGNRGTYNGGGN